MRNPRVYLPSRGRKWGEYMRMTKDEILGQLTIHEGVPDPQEVKMLKEDLVNMLLDYEYGTTWQNPGAAWHQKEAKRYNDLSQQRYDRGFNESGNFYRTSASQQIASVVASKRLGMPNPKRRNPSRKKESLVGLLGGMSMLMLFPIIMGIVFWQESRQK